MSGGVGPTYNDITLPKEKEQEHKIQHDLNYLKTQNQQQTTLSGSKKATFLSFRQLNSLAITIVLAASGMVSLQDLSFVLFSFPYIYFISKFAFPSHSPLSHPPVFDPTNKIFRLYLIVSTVIGLVLPISYIFEGIAEGDKQGIKAAAPHVFLLASQVFMEGVVSVSDSFSLPIRVFIPVFYNSRRMFTLVEWVRDEVSKIDEEYGGSKRRLHLGRALAVGNMAFWSINLFGFLLPVYLPRAFNKYYSVRNNNNKKAVKD